jgi:hypothetical protein
MKELLATILVLLLGNCAVKQVRELRVIDKKETLEICGVDGSASVTQDRAVCIAALLGFETASEHFSAVRSKLQDGESVWELEEVLCDQSPTQLLQATVLVADGSVLRTGRWDFGRILNCP